MLVFAEEVAAGVAGETALRAEAHLIDGHVFAGFLDAALDRVFRLELAEFRGNDAQNDAPLRFVPKGKTVVLGLVTTKRGSLESKDGLKRRIDQASQFLALDQLALSPQCGFASTEEGNLLAAEQQWAKLREIVELADEIWG